MHPLTAEQAGGPTMPRTHLLSNGSYSVMITDAGAGYSSWHDLADTACIKGVLPTGDYVISRLWMRRRRAKFVAWVASQGCAIVSRESLAGTVPALVESVEAKGELYTDDGRQQQLLGDAAMKGQAARCLSRALESGRYAPMSHDSCRVPSYARVANSKDART